MTAFVIQRRLRDANRAMLPMWMQAHGDGYIPRLDPDLAARFATWDGASITATILQRTQPTTDNGDAVHYDVVQYEVATATPPVEPTSDAATGNVWVLTIDHRHGTNITVHRTHNGAHAEVLSYVETWWAEEANPEVEMPADPDTAITQYFDEIASGEYYSIVECPVLP